MRRSVLASGALCLTGALLGTATTSVAAETTIFADDFDSGSAGSPPAGWDVFGDVAIDTSVKDGATGASAHIASFGAFFGDALMAHGFTAQSGSFSIRFTLITSQMPSNIVLNAGEASSGSLAAGFGTGLGVYDDGTIGFGIGDSIQAASADTAYDLRVDVDGAAQTFDVSIDGTKLVTGRSLSFSGSAFDQLTFGGVAGTNGVANVDSVSVFTETTASAPVANAGNDRTVECVAGGATVKLDGTASTTSGGSLSYAWSGDFDGGTATGATPTVHFTGKGTHTVTLVVNDGVSSSSADTMTVTVADTAAPSISVSCLPEELWPANHKMVNVRPKLKVSDVADGTAVDVKLAITCNEPSDGDIVIRSATNFDLRAERSGWSKSGRVYRLVWTATDSSGNKKQFADEIRVQHDQGHCK